MKFDIFKVTSFLGKGNKTWYDYHVDTQYAFMDCLSPPKDDIERSYNQFLCQDFFVPFWKKILWEFVALCAIPVVMFFFWTKGRRSHFDHKVDAIGEKKGMDEIIPKVLSNKYRIDREGWNVDFSLTTDDIMFILFKVWSWRRPYFVLKAIMKIANYSASIVRFRPNAFIVHSEISFCSSLLTSYCNHLGIKHINVMHGEKLKFIRDSYFRFNECYVWDQYYVDLFVRQYAEPSQFVIAIPPSMQINTIRHEANKYADYKYYLAIYTEEQVQSVVDAMHTLKKTGKTVKFRIHPRYSNLSLLRKYVNNEEIEYPSEVGIIDSLANCSCAVGSYTTVLLQAYFSGINVVLDDVAFKETYEQLKEYGYILMNKKQERLSSLIRNI